MTRGRISTEQIVLAYRATGSVWRAGKQLGLAGQTVHDRLRTIGVQFGSRHWTDEERAELRSLYEAEVPLGQIASRLGRTYAGVACQASELGLRAVQKRQRKIPRGAGFDKINTRRHLRAIDAYDGPITRYARANGLSIDLLVAALQKHLPVEWAAYVAGHSDIPQKRCPYCEQVFIPANGKQEYCTRKCGNDARADRDYFGGKRKSTIGLAEQTCQLCLRKGVKGLSSHHYLGKENDPENDHLIALCQGCHNIVTVLGGRTFVDDEIAWETLISLVWLRKHGADFASGKVPSGTVFHVTVDIDTYVDEDEVPMITVPAPGGEAGAGTVHDQQGVLL